ncbi:STE/STE11 protein kinase [Kwoniella heveanensis BCC8398]|uniref:STE/STE11 protein kinase n=1 Tax=Kwoniella heveanensis BCC8398 TaxID=1296120 RepID=A0A1B9H2U9_9TREE|nr:STE/STE11 protein kinase [Kwoniella heveanensis BCC8398]
MSSLSTLRAQLQPITHSPTSSVSSQNTTPTSPHFAQHAQQQSSRHPYASVSSHHLDPAMATVPSGSSAIGTPTPRHQSSINSISTMATSSSSINVVHHPRPPTPPLLHPPPGQTFTAYLRSWGQQELTSFLNLYRCGQYASAFQKNDIDGKVLVDLDMSALKEIGIAKVGERVKLLGGIKDLRKRAAASHSSTSSRFDLVSRSNSLVSATGKGGRGATTTPPLESLDHMVPPSPPDPTNRTQASRLVQPSSSSTSGSTRRLNTSRPPPLDLQQYKSSRPLPQAYQNNLPSASSFRSTPPRANPPAQSLPSQIRPSLSTQNSSSNTITLSNAATNTSSVPAPNPISRQHSLRPPPSRDPGRRSPSPIHVDSSNFATRPLPPNPGAGTSSQQSSAAEYASAFTQQHRQREAETGRQTPTWAGTEHQYGLNKGSAPASGSKISIIKNNDSSGAGVHRKSPSSSGLMGGSTTPKQSSPIKGKFPSIMGLGGSSRSAPQHPFAAASRSREELVPERQAPDTLGSSTGSLPSKRSITPTPGYVVGRTLPSSSNRMRNKTGSESILSTTTASSSGTGKGAPSLDDLRRQLVKFVNAEDGTMRTVNVMHVTSGVEVLERALKKFGKWGTGVHPNTDTESDEDGEKLEVDGWGVYAESDPDDDSKPLSEANLLGICLSHRDGSAIRDKGLTLRRTRKLQNRKNMKEYLGEAPPQPMSPTSPTPFSGPRFGDAHLLTPIRSASGASKKMNRASTVSVMSGLGVPMTGEIPPSPSTARSPSSTSIFSTKKKSVYNFFGHRPPSELISNHLAEYFPSAKKRDVEKARHSMLRMSSGPKRISMAPSESTGRLSFDSTFAPSMKRMSIRAADSNSADVKASPPRRSRPASRSVMSMMTSPPGAGTIPEESEVLDDAPPRLSVSNDDGRPRKPSIDGDSDAESLGSVGSQPPLLPPFQPSNESFADALQAYSPASKTHGRPKSIALNRRNSADSSKSRISYLSQLRRNRDRSDTASLLTVDEITAEVENRRASTITFDESDEEGDDGIVLPAPPPMAPGQAVPEDEMASDEESTEDESEESSTEEEDSEDSDTEDDEDDEEDSEEDNEHGKAFTSTGSKRIIKWIKGALIGAGSFGSVFLGMDAHSGLLMAVKQVELPTGSARNEERKQSMVSALEREIELLKELQHDNIVQYLDSSADANFLNIFLEYVPGGSVAALLSNYGAFEEALVKNFVRQILMGLNYLHEREIIHRDIKGANILVDNKGGIKISDFGISKKVESNLMTGLKANRPSLQGSVFWMAPEIVKQTSYTSKADIWSVGCLVVEMLTGTHPWADLTQMQAIFRIGSQMPVPATPSDISPEAADFLRQTFEIDHNARPTAAQLLEHPFIALPRSASMNGGGARGSMISAAEAQRKMGMAMASANQGMGGFMGK